MTTTQSDIREKLAKRFSNVNTQTGGKGTIRRKKKVAHKATQNDDKKLDAALKKLNTTPIPGIEEVNFFTDDGQVIHFNKPKVQVSIQANTYVISGQNETKSLMSMFPEILGQMGGADLEQIKALFQQEAAKLSDKGKGEDDDDVPELVENFEDVSQKEVGEIDA